MAHDFIVAMNLLAIYYWAIIVSGSLDPILNHIANEIENENLYGCGSEQVRISVVELLKGIYYWENLK